MEAEVTGNEISVDYFYTSTLLNEKTKFNSNNVFAPPNAIREIQKIMASEGNSWSKALFKVFGDGTFEFTPIN